MPGRQLEMLPDPVVPHPLDDAVFINALDGLNGNHFERIDADHEISQRAIARIGSLCSQLADVPHVETDMDTARVDNFFKKQGLRNRPFAVVDADGQRRITRIMNFKHDPYTLAAHLGLMGYNYVRQTKGNKVLSLVAEVNRVHEGAHEDEKPCQILCCRADNFVGGVDYRMLRAGFTVSGPVADRGAYLEESCAGLEEHIFLIDEVGMTNGMLDSEVPKQPKAKDDPEYLLPASYFYESETGQLPYFASSAHASFGMQLLIAKDPGIYPAMIASRKNYAGVREFAQRIEALDRGLYMQLEKHPYDADRFMEATRYIVNRLYNGNWRQAVEVAVEQDHAGTGELLAAA